MNNLKVYQPPWERTAENNLLEELLRKSVDRNMREAWDEHYIIRDGKVVKVNEKEFTQHWTPPKHRSIDDDWS